MKNWLYMQDETNLWTVGYYDYSFNPIGDWISIGHFKYEEDAKQKSRDYNQYERDLVIQDNISKKVRALRHG